MTLQYCSDLHLEFPENKKFLSNNPLQPKGDVLLLAGDIVPFAVMTSIMISLITYPITLKQPTGFLEIMSIIKVMLRSGALHEKIRSNVHLVNNKVIEVKEVTLIFTTLWTNISPGRQWQVEHGMGDFRLIKYNGGLFTAIEYNLLHAECMAFLRESLSKPK